MASRSTGCKLPLGVVVAMQCTWYLGEQLVYLGCKYSTNSLILLWCGLITGLFCWVVSGRWFHSHNAPQLLLTTSWFLHFHMYGFLGPRPPWITHGRVISSTRPRSLRHHLKYVCITLWKGMRSTNRVSLLENVIWACDCYFQENMFQLWLCQLEWIWDTVDCSAR